MHLYKPIHVVINECTVAGVLEVPTVMEGTVTDCWCGYLRLTTYFPDTIMLT